MQVSIDAARVTARGILEVEGWAAGPLAAQRIEILLGDRVLAAPLTVVARPDVESVHPDYVNAAHCGFALRTAMTDDLKPFRELRVNVESEAGVVSSTKTLETPDTVADVVAAPRYNFDEAHVDHAGAVRLSGWAVGADEIVKVNALLDLEMLGSVTYGLARPDVAAAFPAFAGAERSGFAFHGQWVGALRGRHIVTLLMETASGAVFSPSVPVVVEPPTYNFADGKARARVTSVIGGRPSSHSGFEALARDGAGWRCAPRIDERLGSHIAEAAEIEPALGADLLLRLKAHESSAEIKPHETALIAALRACARCHCLVVSQAPLDAGRVEDLFSIGRRFANSARPWLTLLSLGAPAIRYWHRVEGLRREIAFTAIDADAAAGFAVSVVTAAMANHVVVAADSLGLAMMRKYGPRLLAAASRVSLFGLDRPMSDDDVALTREFVAMHLAELHAVVGGRRFWGKLGVDRESLPRGLAERALILDPHEGAGDRLP